MTQMFDELRIAEAIDEMMSAMLKLLFIILVILWFQYQV